MPNPPEIRSDYEILIRERAQKAMGDRIEEKAQIWDFPKGWGTVLAGECLLALDAAGFEFLPPMELDRVAVSLRFVDCVACDVNEVVTKAIGIGNTGPVCHNHADEYTIFCPEQSTSITQTEA